MKEITFGAMVLRLAPAMLCRGAIGYGRSRKQRPAGLRTYMLVCLSAASAVLVSLYLYYNGKTRPDQVLRYCKDSRMTIANLQIRMPDGKRPSINAAEVKVRGNMRPEHLTECISHKAGIVSVAAL